MTSEKSTPHPKTGSQSEVHVKQGFRLTKIFLKLQNDHDRQELIALAERLLEEQNTN
jgi:hypothetical protein